MNTSKPKPVDYRNKYNNIKPQKKYHAIEDTLNSINLDRGTFRYFYEQGVGTAGSNADEYC